MGLVSVQDVAIANIPAAGHGLTVNVFFTPLAAPDFEETPGQLTGCRAWSYDVATKPPPPEQDHGVLRIAGAKNGPLECRFVPQRGYGCPTAVADAQVSMNTVSAQTASVSAPGAAFTSADIGRYLQVSGATSASNKGRFAIVAVPSPTQVIVSNARAATERFAASYEVLAGAGPTRMISTLRSRTARRSPSRSRAAARGSPSATTTRTVRPPRSAGAISASDSTGRRDTTTGPTHLIGFGGKDCGDRAIATSWLASRTASCPWME